MKSETPRTDELSKIVQNQNWGFRDMQILAEKLERELNECREKINGWDISTTNRAQKIANQELAQERGEESDAATETANRGRAV
jgi:hypothetical protein